ncbi:hypothetical protein [Nostoc favosum]
MAIVESGISSNEFRVTDPQAAAKAVFRPLA